MVAYVVAPDFSAFYIHVSKLAQHTTDMQKNKHVGLMISETDDGRADPQTLVRLSVRGVAEFLHPGEPGYTPIKDLYLDFAKCKLMCQGGKSRCVFIITRIFFQNLY